jgi:spheroidene monooxygenase
MAVAALFVCQFDGVLARLAAFAQMGFARLALAKSRDLLFWKLLGTGTGEGFTPIPNFGRYAILTVWPDQATAQHALATLPVFQRWRRNASEHYAVYLAPVSSRGVWDGANPFPKSCDDNGSGGAIAVLTRATVKPRHVISFWRHTPDISALIRGQEHLLFQLGLGEVPWFQQVTFSIWREGGAMTAFAYGDGAHRRAVKDVRRNEWFSEELYARFRVLAEEGSVGGRRPLADAAPVIDPRSGPSHLAVGGRL